MWTKMDRATEAWGSASKNFVDFGPLLLGNGCRKIIPPFEAICYEHIITVQTLG